MFYFILFGEFLTVIKAIFFGSSFLYMYLAHTQSTCINLKSEFHWYTMLEV